MAATQSRSRPDRTLCETLQPASRDIGRKFICVVLSLAGLASCTAPQIRPSGAISGSLSSRAGLPGPTATAARTQKWDCQRIEQAIANLITAMQATKARAEKEQEEMAQTLERMFARLSGPPGAGNAALAELEEARSDVDQLNGLLAEKGCATYLADDPSPSFVQP
jgi:hypothetical protein